MSLPAFDIFRLPLVDPVSSVMEIRFRSCSRAAVTWTDVLPLMASNTSWMVFAFDRSIVAVSPFRS